MRDKSKPIKQPVELFIRQGKWIAAGQQDIVVKQFDAVRDGLALFSGATILADGRPALIVDVGSLL